MGKINTDNYPNRPFSSYQDDDMFVLQDNGGETYTTNVGDIKNLADSRIKLEGVQVNGSDLPISGKKVNVDISGKTDLSVIAYTFNSEMGYFKGAYVTYNGKLYEFIQEHTGAWNPSHVREIKATGRYVRAGNGGYNNGDRATCEGYMTKASGNYSHAEGRETQAVGDCTHAEGIGTIANSIYQHVEGKYNVVDNESKYIHIVGNGIDDNNRSNAFAIDWDGNVEASGDVEDGNGEKISDKTDKVTNATSGHLAGLDSNGNLTDSGVSPTEDVTVEGNPVTFDSPFEQDAKSVVVSVKPIQDLHGLPFPYVGGAYKNKLPMTVDAIKAANTSGTWSGNIYTYNGIDYTILTDGSDNVIGIKENGAASENSFFSFPIPELSAGSYVLNGTPNGLEGVTALYVQTDGGAEEYDNGNSVNFSVTSVVNACGILVVNTMTVTNVIFHPMIRLATESDATFVPYSNICPISGIDEVEIGVTGKNLLNINDCSFDSGKVTVNNGLIKINGTFVNRSVVLSEFVNISELNRLIGKQLVFSKINVKGDLEYSDVFFSGTEVWHYWNTNNTIILDRELTNLVFYLDGTYDVEFYLQIELGSTIATAYEPYTGHTTTIPLPSTLYDADVDVTEGDADSRYGYIASYNGETLPGAWISDRDVYTGSNSPTIGAEVAYELATPTTISFTPADVELLEGTNVVNTNAEKVAVTYGRSLWQDINDLKTDTKGKLDKSDVATIEGDTASKAYSVNEFMLRADGFYKVTAPIAQNASITSSNTTKTTVGEVLTALLNA